MSKVLITGSADGLGREAARQLARGGHEVVLHARDEARAQQALAGVPGAAAAVPGDLSSIAGARALADLINAAGVFDAIIHNASIGYREPARRETEDDPGPGTATRRTPTPSSSTRCSPPRWLAGGRTSSAAPWTPDG